MDTNNTLNQIKQMFQRQDHQADIRHNVVMKRFAEMDKRFAEMDKRFAEMELIVHTYHGDLLKLHSDVDDMRAA